MAWRPTWSPTTRPWPRFAIARPASEGDFLQIAGIGRTKVERYGAQILEIIARS
ncbi:MAG: HRDC domain-containing protein [Chloroflexi bacterium]|nr:HRDC domain-containing protein [Chloroflexota bacterium]